MKLKKKIQKLEKEILEFEGWMIERKNFFIKLGWTGLFFVLLMIVCYCLK